jgi:hypothetical protein
MPNSNFFGWTFPDDTQDPYFDTIRAFFSQQDESVFALLNSASNIIIPPSAVAWSPSFHQLTWNADFEIPLMKSGFSLKVKFGPDGINRFATINDGQRLIVTVPTTSTGEVTANFAVVDGIVTGRNGLFTVGFCRGLNFYANFPQVYT